MITEEKKLVDKLLSRSNGLMIIDKIPTYVYFIDQEICNRGMVLIWLDANQHIHDNDSLVEAFHTAFHYYESTTRNINAVNDYLQDQWYMPYRACILLINDTDEIRKNDPIVYDVLKYFLVRISKFWKRHGYTFRSILVEKNEENGLE